MTQQREAMTQDTSTSGPAGGLDAPGGTPYPDIAGKIVRLVDYWDGRGFGAGLAASLRVPADSYPDDLGARAVTSRPGPVATAAAELSAAFAAGDAGRGGGYEWRGDGRPVAAGAAALQLSPDGKISRFTVVWDGSLLDDRAITALAAVAVDK